MTTEYEDLPFDMDAFKAAFKNVKHMNDLTKDGGPRPLRNCLRSKVLTGLSRLKS